MKQLNAKEIKEHASIVTMLSALGYEPKWKSGAEHLYISPLRDSDVKPSFSVNDKIGCWYDHGEGKGGNIIDLGILLWKNLAFGEILEKIVSLSNSAVALGSEISVNRRKRLPVKEPHYRILEIKDLGANEAILAYLQSRGVFDCSKGLLKEVYYYVENERKDRKHFFAAGWQNELGAWEISSIDRKKFCLGRKAISFIPGDEGKIAVFEGFFDYLSWLAENPFSTDSVLVLNSVALVQSGISKAQGFDSVSTYFDHDPAGRNATVAFISALPQSIDRSSIYEGFNDYNDMLVAGLSGRGVSR